MKKNTKIIVWSIVGLVVATGAFFGIRSLVKKSKARRAVTDTPAPDPVLDVKNSNADVPPTGETTTLTQAQANAIAYSIFKLNKQGVSPAILNKTKELTAKLEKSGYSYQNGKAVKNVG